MAHRAGGRTCRGRRPGPPSWSAGIRAPPRAPPPRSGARARSGDSPARRQAQRAVLGSSLRPSRAGRQFGCSLPPSPPAGLYKLGPPPALRGVPASALPRRPGVPGTPAAPRTSAPRQSSGLGLASRDPRPKPGARRRPPTPNRVGAAAQCARREGQGALLPGGPGRNAKERVPRAWLPREAPHAQLRPAWPERLSLCCRRREDAAPPGDRESARGPSPEDQHRARLGLGGRPDCGPRSFQPHLSSPPALY